MFEVKVSNYNLKKIPEKAEAYLSDLFFILYILYIADKEGEKIDKIKLHKSIAYILEQLDERKKIDEIKVFNLPLYRYHYGHYNKSIDTEYANKLHRDGLIDVDGNDYILTEKGIELIKDFDVNFNNKEKEFVKEIIQDYISKYIARGFLGIVSRSHTAKVIDNGKEKSVEDLPKDEYRAIAYNSSPETVRFDEVDIGKKATIFSASYLLRLNTLLEEEEVEINSAELLEKEKIISGLLHCRSKTDKKR